MTQPDKALSDRKLQFNIIPPMTDALGKHWRQPDPARILLDDEHAVMDEQTFTALNEYSTTLPSGVYPGKMWRANIGNSWMLRWFGECGDPTRCSNNQREILLVRAAAAMAEGGE